MKKIKMHCGESEINTTCEGTSQHIYNKIVVHKLSKPGIAWVEALPDNHGPVIVETTHSAGNLDYLTLDPLP